MARIEIKGTGLDVSKVGDQLTLNSEPIQHNLLKLDHNTYHLIVDNRSYKIDVLSKNTSTGELTIKVNGRMVHTKLQNKLSQLLKTMGMESGKKKLKELKAPMPGLVLNVLVSAGEHVSEGQDLMILEAMKMENAIKSPQDGVIEAISIQKNDKVDKNQALISFE